MTENNALKLAVVGHTNVGKTSLLRTLTRDVDFGEVSHRPSTTRDVQGARLSVDGEALVELYDTPGMEDAIDLLSFLEHQQRPGERLDGPARIARFLEGSEARQRYEQEAKVLRRLLAADAGLYVIDAREPVLAKYRDELEILGMCGRPLLPVLNFVSHSNTREAQWREVLSRLGLHALVRFDTVSPSLDGERLLYESLALLAERSRAQLQRLIEDQQTQRQLREQSARRLISELLIDVAACRRQVADHPQLAQQALHDLHDEVRRREQRCVEALLRLYGFRNQDASAQSLPLLDGRWGDDLFNPETLKHLGIRVGGGMAAGAAAGAGVDLLVGGITLGAAALLGAVVGGSAQTARHYGQRLAGKFKGQRELTVDDSILRLLAVRQHQLLSALQARGHAATERMQLDVSDDKKWREGKLPDALKRARAHPEWSALDSSARLEDSERQLAIVQLSA